MDNLEIQEFILSAAKDANRRTNNTFDYLNFPLEYLDLHYCNMAFVDGRPVGFMFATRYSSIFDQSKVLLRQDFLYTPEGSSPFICHRLMQDFIDFGKLCADHILTVRGPGTNIKGSSLERLGFKELETLYRMEVGGE